MTDLTVDFHDLGHAYTPERWVLRHYSATVERGSVLAILGPNGRGKTTLLKLLLGAMRASEGTIHVKGTTAFVPQLFHVSFDYSVLDMVLMGRARQVSTFALPSKKDETAALAALHRFELTDSAHRAFHELSGGERQMVIFARALAADARILILDEPLAALDLKHQAVTLDWIRRLAREDGMTVLFTTHLPQHALVADRTLLMQGIDDFNLGESAAILTEANLSRLYGIAVKRVAFQHDGRTLQTFAPVLDQATR